MLMLAAFLLTIKNDSVMNGLKSVIFYCIWVLAGIGGTGVALAGGHYVIAAACLAWMIMSFSDIKNEDQKRD